MVDISKYIERAEQEVKRRNFDHAMTLFGEILQIDPDCGDARAGIRQAALKKFEKRYPSSIQRAVTNLPARCMLGIAKLLKSHNWTVNLCEGALRRDPRNVRLNHRLGHALLALGHRQSAEAAFRVVTEFDQKDIDSLKILGRLYSERKELEKALDCYERALRINPRDQEAGKMRKNLAAEGAIKSGGYEGARSARELAKSQRQLVEAERAQKIVRTADEVRDAIDELKQSLEETPGDVKLLIKLGRLHVQAQDLDAAVEVYAEARKAEPENAEVLDLLGDARVRRFEIRLAEAEAQAQAGEDGAEDRARRLKRELNEFLVEEYRRRVEAHPTEMGLRFRLGRHLLEDGNTDEAIEQFQQAVRDPKHRVPGLQLLGRAFAAKGILDLAVKQLTEAAGRISGMTDQKKEILYELAQVHERNGSADEARAIYKDIYESDISYRDVGQRIEALKS